MNEAISTAIKALVSKAVETKNPGEALHLTQAALNLAHVAATFSHIKKD